MLVSERENEITDAVIRKVSPSLQLRSYLEMIQDLTLTRLRLIMKAHFKQKSGTELYQELSNLRQETSETPHDFLVRAMSLRQQVILYPVQVIVLLSMSLHWYSHCSYMC